MLLAYYVFLWWTGKVEGKKTCFGWGIDTDSSSDA